MCVRMHIACVCESILSRIFIRSLFYIFKSYFFILVTHFYKTLHISFSILQYIILKYYKIILFLHIFFNTPNSLASTHPHRQQQTTHCHHQNTPNPFFHPHNPNPNPKLPPPPLPPPSPKPQSRNTNPPSPPQDRSATIGATTTLTATKPTQTQTHNHHTRKPTTNSTATFIASVDCTASSVIAEDLWVERELLTEIERERAEQREERGQREKERKK